MLGPPIFRGQSGARYRRAKASGTRPRNLPGLTVEAVAKPPNRVRGVACNVTDKTPIKPGARRVARRCYKRAEVSWVWPVLAILVKVSRVRYKAIWRFGAI